MDAEVIEENRFCFLQLARLALILYDPQTCRAHFLPNWPLVFTGMSTINAKYTITT